MLPERGDHRPRLPSFPLKRSADFGDSPVAIFAQLLKSLHLCAEVTG
jgi:hypothetical protein